MEKGGEASGGEGEGKEPDERGKDGSQSEGEGIVLLAADAAEEEDGVEINVGVEEAEGEKGDGGFKGRLAGKGDGGEGLISKEGAEREGAVEEEKEDRGVVQESYDVGILTERAAESEHAKGDEEGVDERTEESCEEKVLPAQTLSEDERILGADRHNQAAAG